MPGSVKWYIENDVIYSHYSGVMTGDELRVAFKKILDMIESSPRHLVHIVSDVGDVTEGVPLKESIRILREVGSHVRSGWSISIREKSILMKLSASLGSSLFRMRFKTFDTMDQAVAFLKMMDETLNWDKVDQSVAEPGRK